MKSRSEVMRFPVAVLGLSWPAKRIYFRHVRGDEEAEAEQTEDGERRREGGRERESALGRRTEVETAESPKKGREREKDTEGARGEGERFEIQGVVSERLRSSAGSAIVSSTWRTRTPDGSPYKFCRVATFFSFFFSFLSLQ